MKKSIFLILIVVFIALSFISCTKKQDNKVVNTNQKQDIIKVAFVYIGPVGDSGWTYAHDLARKKLEHDLPYVKTTYVENVKEGQQAEQVFRQLASSGYKIIFATSFGYMDTLLKVAKEFPDVVFMHCSGYKRSKNVGTYYGKMYQAEFLSGIIAGKMTKTNKIGFVAPYPIPEVIRHINAFTLGVREVNKKAKVHVVWVNSWYNPGKEKEAANSLIDAKCDILMSGCDSPTVLQTAQQRGVLGFGYDSDNRQFAPKAFLTAPIWHWEVIYEDVVKKVKENKWKSCDYFGGLDTGVISLAKMSDLVPEKVKKVVLDYEKKIKEGKYFIFKGPIYGQDGKTIVIKSGHIPSEEELFKMRFFVDSVVGNIPK